MILNIISVGDRGDELHFKRIVEVYLISMHSARFLNMSLTFMYAVVKTYSYGYMHMLPFCAF